MKKQSCDLPMIYHYNGPLQYILTSDLKEHSFANVTEPLNAMSTSGPAYKWWWRCFLGESKIFKEIGSENDYTKLMIVSIVTFFLNSTILVRQF